MASRAASAAFSVASNAAGVSTAKTGLRFSLRTPLASSAAALNAPSSMWTLPSSGMMSFKLSASSPALGMNFPSTSRVFRQGVNHRLIAVFVARIRPLSTPMTKLTADSTPSPIACQTPTQFSFSQPMAVIIPVIANTAAETGPSALTMATPIATMTAISTGLLSMRKLKKARTIGQITSSPERKCPHSPWMTSPIFMNVWRIASLFWSIH